MIKLHFQPLFFLKIVSFLLIKPFLTFSNSFSERNSSSIDVYFYNLQVKIDPSTRSISGKNTIYFTTGTDLNSFELDLDTSLSINNISDAAGHTLPFKREKSNKITIWPENVIKAKSTYQLAITYGGNPKVAVNPPWGGGFIWQNDSLDRTWAGVACEEDGASLWWPCHDSWADEPDSMRLEFTVPESLKCVSNGNLVNENQESPGWKNYIWKVSYPINVYNVTFNLGNYINISDTMPGLKLDYYVLDYNREKATNHFRQVKIILSTFDTLFGPYPFPKDGYALVETPYWGMEHQSAIAYGNNYRNQASGFDFIILHETAHEWWGNNVTANDPGNMWIHEAFATYSEFLFLEKIYGWDKAIMYLNQQKTKIENKKPVQGPIGINFHIYEDTDMYYKGAWMLHTIRSIIADDPKFFSLIKKINLKYGKKTIDSKTIVSFFNKNTGKDLTSVFAKYLNDTVPPILEYSIKKTKANIEVLYRWKGQARLKMPLDVVVNSTPIRISPSATWKTLKVNSAEIDFKLDNDRFLVLSEKLP